MKKKAMALVLVTGLALSTAASANWGGNGRWNNGAGGCGNRQVMMNPQLDPETKVKVDQFFKDNQALHKEIAMKRAEKRAIMMSDQPDPVAAAQVTGELFDLHATLKEKAVAAGVDQYVGPPMRGGQGRFSGPGNFQGQGRKRMQ